MATSQQLKYNVENDVVQVLTDEGVANAIDSHATKPSTATFVRCICNTMGSDLQAGTIPTGVYRARMSIECWSYQQDDETGSALSTLNGSVRDAVYVNNIISTLNTASTYHTYYGMIGSGDIADEEAGYRIIAIQFDLILRPEK